MDMLLALWTMSRAYVNHFRFSTKAAPRRGAGAPGGALSEWTQRSDGMTSETASKRLWG
jgi:hypothetical protein